MYAFLIEVTYMRKELEQKSFSSPILLLGNPIDITSTYLHTNLDSFCLNVIKGFWSVKINQLSKSNQSK